MPDNFETEASKEDPDGFSKLEALTKNRLNVSKADVDKRRQSEKNPPNAGAKCLTSSCPRKGSACLSGIARETGPGLGG